jgi:hypothetical protein
MKQDVWSDNQCAVLLVLQFVFFNLDPCHV